MASSRTWVLCAALALAVLAAYANHFQNEFHFDDSHTIVNNVFIEDLRNIPRFFTDATLFTSKPGGAVYRPVTSASLAIDYWLGGGRKLFYFHLSTFIWFVVQVILMFFLFRRIMDLADPHPWNLWTALFAAACYGLHPVNAETVNYIIQRADLYCALGIVASLLWFVAQPAQRKRGWYLLPAVAAFLAKATALVYPFILLVYVFLFEYPDRKQWKAAIRATMPAFLVTGVSAVLISRMTAATFDSGAASASLYRLTQPWVALHYFKSFFLPTELSADSDWTYVTNPFTGEALAGYGFVLALLAAIWYTARKRETKPIAFGLLWFILAMLPTSLMPLSDVTNDHRMFFPFVGLVLAVFWSLRLALFRQPSPALVRAAIAGLGLVLIAEAAGTHERNEVWKTEESLWRDVAEKSPQNGRGLMGYAAVFLNRGDFPTAISYLERARELMPNYSGIEINLGMAYGGLGRDTEAAQHFQRAAELVPGAAEPHFYYGRWLQSKGRVVEAQAQLEKAVQLSPLYFQARYLLMEVYSQTRNPQAFDALVQDTLRLAYNDETARRYVEQRAKVEAARPAASAPAPVSPEALLGMSAGFCRAGKYEDCLAGAKKALELRPGYAEAYNTMAAAYGSMGKWDEAVKAATEAVRLKPESSTARNNLQWATEHQREAEYKR